MHLTCRLHGVRSGLPRLRCGAGVRSRQSGIAHGSPFRQQAVSSQSTSAQAIGCGRSQTAVLVRIGLTHATPPLSLQPAAPPLRFGNDLAYNSRRPLETRAPPAHRASLVCGVVNAPGLVGSGCPLSRGPYFISIPTSLGLSTTSFGSIFAMWSFAAVPLP